MRTEIWKNVVIKGEVYDNYKVSNLGRLINLNYRGTGKNKLLKPSKNTNGYLQVFLRKDGKRKMFLVHRLVVETFLPNPDGLPEVNHKDEDKTNNSVENLEWCTHEYNTNYGTRTEKTSKPVLQLSLTGEFIKEWKSTQECGRNGYIPGNIVKCCRGKRKSAHGFRWEYA